MKNYLDFLISSFCLAMVILALSLPVSKKLKMIGKKRKVPFSGGISLALAFIVPYLIFVFRQRILLPLELIYLLVFSLAILAIEVLDDFKDLSVKLRIISQIVFIFFFLQFGKKIQIYFLPDWLNYIISFLWIMGITNAFNLFDIADGLCSGLAIMVSLAFLGVAIIKGNFLLAGLFASLSGAIIAFYFFNYPPAKIFLGNSGAHFLGFLFVTLSIYGDYATAKNPISLIAPVLILAFPVIDTIYLIVVRVKKKIIPVNKSNDHIYLRLLAKGYSKKKAL